MQSHGSEESGFRCHHLITKDVRIPVTTSTGSNSLPWRPRPNRCQRGGEPDGREQATLSKRAIRNRRQRVGQRDGPERGLKQKATLAS
jgi:hypothetical protein